MFKNWIVLSGISAICLSAMFLVFQRLQSRLSSDVYLSYTWIGSGLILLTISLGVNPTYFVKALWAVPIAAIGSWLGMTSYSRAMMRQPNIGLIEALSSIRTPIIALVSLLSLGGSLSGKYCAAMMVALIGYVCTAYSSRYRVERNYQWMMWSVLSAIMFAVLVLATKYMLRSGMDYLSVTALVLLSAGVLFAAHSILTQQAFSLGGESGMIFLAIALSSAGNLALFISYQLSPNPAYANVISGARIPILFLAALLRRQTKAQTANIVGIILVTVGILMFG